MCATLGASAQPLKLKNIDAARSRIWAEWVGHWQTEARTSLPQQELTDQWHFTWTLPDSLEPNAQWNYYWGHEGQSDQPRPLTIYLHGSGPRDAEWTTGYKLARRFAREVPGYYYVPQIPQEGRWYRWYQRSKQWAYEHLLRRAMVQGDIDPDRIYLIGISEGGYGSQRLASFYADYLAGAGPMAGGEPLKNAPAENCGNIAFSLLTGVKDKGFYRDELTYWTQQAFDSLQVLYPDRYLHRVNLIPGYGHFIPYDLTLRWLKHSRRQAQPRHFQWEDFEMDGRHRQGFYNLEVVDGGRQMTDSGRRMYQMDIEGQTVRLKVEDITYSTIQTDTIWGIEMRFARQFTPAKQGRVRLYLSPELVDLSRPITVILGDRCVFRGRVECDECWLRQSLALFGDPRRLFPAALDIEISKFEN